MYLTAVLLLVFVVVVFFCLVDSSSFMQRLCDEVQKSLNDDHVVALPEALAKLLAVPAASRKRALIDAFLAVTISNEQVRKSVQTILLKHFMVTDENQTQEMPPQSERLRQSLEEQGIRPAVLKDLANRDANLIPKLYYELAKHEEIICPITLEPLRVKRGDVSAIISSHHIYLFRASALKRWLTHHTTNPYTNEHVVADNIFILC